MHLLCTYMFLHCTYIFKNTYVITSVINFCNYIYNYTLTHPLHLNQPTQTTKPVPNLTLFPPQ